MILIFPPEPSKECVKVSHVIFECRVINHHPHISAQIYSSKTNLYHMKELFAHNNVHICAQHVCFRSARFQAHTDLLKVIRFAILQEFGGHNIQW